MLASIVSFIPGSSNFAAWRAQKNLLRGNRVRREHKPTLRNRHLFWAARHPIIFAAEIALVCAAFGWLVWPVAAAWLLAAMRHLSWLDTGPTVAGDWTSGSLDVGAFIGVPWGVQATLVALVYPLVLSFVAVFLQRRAKAEAVLRIYMLSSGILPAGASSMALLAALSAEYFATPVLKPIWPDVYQPIVVGTGLWFLINIVLTTLFLGRTLKYLQAEEQRASVWKAAIGVIYYEEMRESLRQSIAAMRLTMAADGDVRSSARVPRVRPISGGDDSVSSVTRDLVDGSVLGEVFLPFLELVARSWMRRALVHEDATKACLYLGLHFGRSEGIQRLAVVTAGPKLLWWERVLVKLSFFYRPRPSKLVTLTTSGLLNEMSSAVLALADQGHLEEAADAVADMTRLVNELVNSGHFIGDEGEDNAALLSEPRYIWWGHPLHWGWIRAFSDICGKAVEQASRSQQLFRAAARVSLGLLNGMHGSNAKVAQSSMNVFNHLDFQLAQWWRRNVDVPPVGSGGLPRLSPVNQSLYEELLAVMVGVWSDVVHPISIPKGTSDIKVWNSECVSARLLVQHLDSVSKLLFKAVERGDVTASRRYCDLFLKWAQFNLGMRDTGYLEFQPAFSTLGLSLLKLNWADARFALATEDAPADIHRGRSAVALAVRRHFEAMRLQLIVMLLAAAPADMKEWGAGSNLAVDMAVALLKGEALHRGGGVTVDTITSPDDVLERLVHGGLVERATAGHLENFASGIHRDSNAPDVSGWAFGGSMPRFDILGNVVGWTRLLAMLQEVGRTHSRTSTPKTTRLLARLWRDVNQSLRAAEFFGGLVNALGGEELPPASTRAAFDGLRDKLGKEPLTDEQLMSVSDACRGLADTARWHRFWTIKCTELTPTLKNAFLRGLVTRAMTLTRENGALAPIVEGDVQSEAKDFLIECDRESLVQGVESAEARGRDSGSSLRQAMEAWAMADVLAHLNATALEEPQWSADFSDTTPEAVFRNRVGAEVQRLRNLGIEPAVALWAGRASLSLRPEGPYEVFLASQVKSNYVVLRENINGQELTTIEGAPILQRQTPKGACYVVPLKSVAALVVSPTNLQDSSVKAEWTVPKDKPLSVYVRVPLHGEFPEPTTPTATA